MPLKNDLLITFKEGVADLATTVVDAHTDDPESFLLLVRQRLFEHQYLLMTDPSLLGAEIMGARSSLVSRDPLPQALAQGLTSMGFVPLEPELGGRNERSFFTRLQRGRRAKLDSWSMSYFRCRDASPLLAELEDLLADEVPEGRLSDVFEEAAKALIDAERTVARVLLAPNLEGLEILEQQILSARNAVHGRLILRPAFTRALAAITALTTMSRWPTARWADKPADQASVLVVPNTSEIIETDPELRVVQFVVRGTRELLTAYVRSLAVSL